MSVKPRGRPKDRNMEMVSGDAVPTRHMDGGREARGSAAGLSQGRARAEGEWRRVGAAMKDRRSVPAEAGRMDSGEVREAWNHAGTKPEVTRAARR